MSTITEVAQDVGIQDLAEISQLEHFFQNPEIIEELETAEKYRIRRYMWLIPSCILTVVWLMYLASLWVIHVEIWDTGRYRTSETTDGIFWSIIGVFIIVGIIVSIFRSKIEGAIKKKILTKLAKELYSKLDYDDAGGFAFWDLGFLRSKWFLSSYDQIDTVEDSVWFYIEEDRKILITQGYELQTSEIRGSGKHRKRVTTNHCYLLKVRFPQSRIPLENTLFIRSDEFETVINGGLKYALIGGFIWFMIWGFFAGFLWDGTSIIGMLLGAFWTYFWRKWQKGKKRIILENGDFEKLYDVECTDPIGSRMIITPAFMDRLVRFAEKVNINLSSFMKSIAFISNGIFHELILRSILGKKSLPILLHMSDGMDRWKKSSLSSSICDFSIFQRQSKPFLKA